MKSPYTIAIAVIMLAAVFAGVAVISDDVDAEAGDYKFTVEGVTYTVSLDPTKDKLPTLNEVAPGADATYFQGWVENSESASSVYAPGSQIPTKSVKIEEQDKTVHITDYKAKFIEYSISFVDTITTDGKEWTVEGDITADGSKSSVKAGTAISLPALDKVTIKKVDVSENSTSLSKTQAEGGQNLFTIEYKENNVTKFSGKFQFIGWAIVGADGKTIGTEVYAPGSEYTPTKDVKFAAVYNDGYTVTFNADGITTTEKSIGLKPADVSAPSKVGYTFDGWYDANGVKFDDKYVFTSDVTFTAKFVPTNKTVTFKVGEFTQTQTVPYGSKAMAPALPEGYDAWCVVKVAEDGTEVYEVFDFNTVITKDVSLVAREAAEPEPAPVTVTFKIETATYGPYVISDRFNIPNTDREGYAFAGWLLAGGDGTKLTNEQVSKLIGETKESLVFTATYDVVEPPAPVEPPFWETTNGQIAIILVVFAILAFGYAVYTNMFGLKDKLFGFKIERKNKKE